MQRRTFAAVAAIALVAGSLPITSAFAQAVPVPCPDGASCLMTGGPAGDYFLHFAKPTAEVLAKTAWEDLIIATSAGTPANMKAVAENQGHFGLGQANVVGLMIDTEPYKGKLKIVETQPIGQELLFLVVNDALYKRAQYYGIVAQNAGNVKFVLPSPNSGPGATFDQMMNLDPRLQKAKSITRVESVDDAINAVASGAAQATLVVQFANPNNPRFKLIKEKGLHIVPVRHQAMLSAKMANGQPMFVACGGQEVGRKELESGVCTPIVLMANAANTNDKLPLLASVPGDHFAPKDVSFGALWKKVRAAAAKATADAASWANEKVGG